MYLNNKMHFAEGFVVLYNVVLQEIKTLLILPLPQMNIHISKIK